MPCIILIAFLFPRCVIVLLFGKMQSYESFSTERVKQNLVSSLILFQLPTRFILCAAMEQFFSPTRRLQDIWEEYYDDDPRPFEYTELQLAVPVEEFLNYQHCDWDDFFAFASSGVIDKILWITNLTFLLIKNQESDFFDVDALLVPGHYIEAVQETSGREQILRLVQIAQTDIPVSTRELGVFWRAIMTSSSVELSLYGIGSLGLPSGPALSQFLQESPSLELLEFRGFDFNEEHCRALATLQRTDIEVKFSSCKLDPQDAEDTFIEWFRNNQVVTELSYCEMGCRILSALSGNNSVKKLYITRFGNAISKDGIRSLIQALPGNLGIEHLAIGDVMSDETWSLFFHSLATHPRMKFMTIFPCTFPHQPLSAESKSSRMKAILRMVYLNTVVRTIDVSHNPFIDEEVFQSSILPRLEMNRSCFELQRQAVKRAGPSIRPQLLGRALHAVRYNPELVFLFLSENVPAFVRTEENPIILLA
jgi:hypothetical protein